MAVLIKQDYYFQILKFLLFMFPQDEFILAITYDKMKQAGRNKKERKMQKRKKRRN